MARPRKLHAIGYVLLYLLAIFILVAALFSLTILPMLGMPWMVPVAGIVFSLILIGILSKTPLHVEILQLLENIIPGFRAVMNWFRYGEKNRKLLREMESTINFYKLGDRFEIKKETQQPYFCFSEQFQRKTTRKIHPQTESRYEALKICARAVEEISSPPLAENISLALCLDENNEGAKNIYGRLKNNETEINELATILEQSRRLPSRELIPYDKNDIRILLNKLDVYSFKQIREELEGLQISWEIAAKYREFLAENEIEVQEYELTIEDLLRTLPISASNQKIVDPLPTKDKNILASLLHISHKVLAETPNTIPLSYIALAIFFTTKFPSYQKIIIAICQLAAPQKVAVNMAYAYIELREQYRHETSFVNLQTILTDWEELNVPKDDESGRIYEQEIEALRQYLNEGRWITRLKPLVDKTLSNVSENWKTPIEEFTTRNKERPDIKAALRRVFSSLNIKTIERFLEASAVTAYLITFNTQSGRFADLLDCFVDSTYAKLLKKADIEMTYEGHKKFAFMPYIKQTRIGIVPKGMTFREFCKQFEKDLEKALPVLTQNVSSALQIKKFEIIIHRFGLAGRDRYDFDNFNTEHQLKKAYPRINYILANNLDVEDLVRSAGYEFGADQAGMNKLIDLMLEEKISELVSLQVGDITSAEQKYLDTYHTKWQASLTQKFSGHISFTRFAKELPNKKAQKDIIKAYLVKLMRDAEGRPETLKDIKRRRLIVSKYIDTLTDLASITA